MSNPNSVFSIEEAQPIIGEVTGAQLIRVQALYTTAVSAPDRRWKSWLVPLIIAANIAVFLGTMYANNCRLHSNPFGPCFAGFLGRFAFQPMSQNPFLGPSFQLLERLGSLHWDKVVNHHQGWRLVTYMWLHGGVIHLLAIILGLVFIGVRLEQVFGFVSIGVIYLTSGFGSGILSSLYNRHSISLGASGAIFGLFGAILSELMTNWNIYTTKTGALIRLLIGIGINVAVSFLPIVDKYAHLGGFITGFLLGFLLLLRPQLARLQRHDLPDRAPANPKFLAYQYILAAIALTLLISGFILGLTMLFRGA